MMNLVKKYWKHILFFGSYLLVLMICRSTDVTQLFKNDDSFSFLYGAKFLEQKYPVPLWNVLGYIPANLPFGTDAGNIIICLSVIPAFLSSIIVFISLRKLTDDEWAPWIGSSTLMGCCLFFSQAVSMEIYVLMAFLVSLTFLLILYQKYTLAGIICGLAICAHYSTGIFPLIAFFVGYGGFRKRWYAILLTALIFYSFYYMCLDSFYWQFYEPSFDRFMNLWLAVIFSTEITYPTKYFYIFNILILFIVGFGFSLIPMFLGLKEIKKLHVILFICMIPTIFVFIGNNFTRFTQIVSFVPLMAIFAGIGIKYIRYNFLKIVIFTSSILMMISFLFSLNANLLDESPTTARQLINSFDRVEDGSLILTAKIYHYKDGGKSDTLGGHIAAAVGYYNNLHNTDIIPVYGICIYSDDLDWGRDKLISKGVNLPEQEDIVRLQSLSSRDIMIWYQNLMISLKKSNPDKEVYIFLITDIYTQKTELVTVDEWKDLGW